MASSERDLDEVHGGSGASESVRTLPGAATPHEARAMIRAGQWSGYTAGFAPGFAQANLAILPRALAYDFLLFCVRNPKPCPILDVTDAGSPVPRLAAPGADLRTDLPGYRVF